MAMRPRRRARRLFVTGGSGFLGTHVVNGRASEPWEIVAPGSASLDLRNRDAVLAAIRDWRPDAIVHTAYRRDERASIVEASRHVAEAAAATSARLVHVSTDAVFAGQLAAYSELDLPKPVHAYGHDKADAEDAVSSAVPSAVIVRTSLILGTDELSPHERLVRDVVSGRNDVAFFTDEVRSPVLVGDLAAALVDLAHRREITGVVHLGGPDTLSRAALALMTAHRYGWPDSKLRFSSIAESGLTRPSRVVLDSSRAASYGIGVRGPSSWEPR